MTYINDISTELKITKQLTEELLEYYFEMCRYLTFDDFFFNAIEIYKKKELESKYKSILHNVTEDKYIEELNVNGIDVINLNNTYITINQEIGRNKNDY